MRSWTAEQAYDTDYLTPFPFDDEVSEMVGVIHSLDAWNFVAGSLAAAKLELGAVGDIRIVPVNVLQSYAVSASAVASDVFPMLDAAGNPWIETFPSGDGELQIELGCYITNTAGGFIVPFWIGVRVDGDLVGQSGCAPNTLDLVVARSWWMQCVAPVGAGNHVIEMVWGLADTAGVFGTLSTIEFSDRHLSIREAAR